MTLLLRRGAFYLLTAWVAISVNFALPRLMPGSPADALIDKFRGKLSPSAVTAMRALFGETTDSLWQQYLNYWADLFHGNLGITYAYYPASVTTVLGTSIFWTLTLITVATVLSFVIGTVLGAVVGWRRGSWTDALVPITMFVSSIPYFWFAIITVLILAVTLKWFPISGGYSVLETIGWNTGFISSAVTHAVLPALTIVIASVGGWLLSMRNMMVTTMGEDYVRLAEAKGIPQRRIMITYAARNAILPSFSAFAMSLGMVVGGSVVTEIVFNYPGIGTVLFKAAQAHDYPLMQGVFLVITLAVLVANLLADAVYVLLDPRTREG